MSPPRSTRPAGPARSRARNAPGPETGQPGDQVRHVGAPADERAAAAERRVVHPAGRRVAELDGLDQGERAQRARRHELARAPAARVEPAVEGDRGHEAAGGGQLGQRGGVGAPQDERLVEQDVSPVGQRRPGVLGVQARGAC